MKHYAEADRLLELVLCDIQLNFSEFAEYSPQEIADLLEKLTLLQSSWKKTGKRSQNIDTGEKEMKRISKSLTIKK